SVAELTVRLLTFNPGVVPVTFTAKLHDAIAASVAPDRLMLFAPAVAVIAPPPHEPVSPLGVATTRPAGRVSVDLMPISDSIVFGLLMLKLRVVLAFCRMDAAPNILVPLGGNGSKGCVCPPAGVTVNSVTSSNPSAAPAPRRAHEVPRTGRSRSERPI